MDEGRRNAVRANVLAEDREAMEYSGRREANGVLCEPPLDVWLFPDPQPKGIRCYIGMLREEVCPVSRPLFVDMPEAALTGNS